MKKYRFSLVRTVSFFPRKVNEKVVFIPAESSMEARKTIDRDYSDWAVSMFWPVV